MSSNLSRVTKGKKVKPILMLAHGPDGVGKTSLAAEAPSPIFLEAEQGSDNLDVARLPKPDKWSDVLDCLEELGGESHAHKTLVVDSLDWLERLIMDHICKKYGVDSIELAAGGYGKGYGEVLDQWVVFQNKLSWLRESKGMHIICIAHSQVAEFNDPTTDVAYNRYELKLYRSKSGNIDCRALWREYVDILAFANYEVFTKGEDNKSRAVSTNVRKLYLERDARWDAKNRHTLTPSVDMVLGQTWNNIYNQVYENKDKAPDTKQILAECQELLAKIENAETKENARRMIDEGSHDYKLLETYKERLGFILNEQA